MSSTQSRNSIAETTNDQQPANETPVLLRPRDPLIFRDARPFAADPGARAFSLRWPMPRTVAGALRTYTIESTSDDRLDWKDNKDAAQAARRIDVRGPLLAARFPGETTWRAHVPTPADLVPFRKTVRKDNVEEPAGALSFMCLRPEELDEDEGCDLPDINDADSNGLRAAMSRVALRPLSVSEEFKPETDVPAWWSITDAEKWLTTTATDEQSVRDALKLETRGKGDDEKEHLVGINSLPVDARSHVSIDPDKLTNVDGALFATESCVFRDEPRARFDASNDPLGTAYRAQHDMPALGILCNLAPGKLDGSFLERPGFLTLGGERRMARFESATDAPWPQPTIIPSDDDLKTCNRLRLLIVTPAIFTHGWLPGWMADGVPPGLKDSKLELRLVGATTGRRVPYSGWRLTSPSGPRKTFHAVPGGSVYFFECKRGTLTEDIWRALWLAPVSDLQVHRADGFGLVLPGIW